MDKKYHIKITTQDDSVFIGDAEDTPHKALTEYCLGIMRNEGRTDAVELEVGGDRLFFRNNDIKRIQIVTARG